MAGLAFLLTPMISAKAENILASPSFSLRLRSSAVV